MMIMKQKKNPVGTAVVVAMMIVVTAVGCNEDKQASSTVEDCVDALCYGSCEAENGEEFSESFWVLNSAYCRDNDHCACNYGCDNDACAEYCRETKGYLRGSCDSFSCVCIGRPSTDAGDTSDAGDTDDTGDAD